MAESAALKDPAQDAAQGVQPRERFALGAFVFVSVTATLAWLVLLGWLVLVGLRAVGV
jgi:hypothetical protein